MVIVNTDILFNQLKQHIQTKPFVLLQMYSDVQQHPQENRISCYWVDFQFEQYIVPIYHTEKFCDNLPMIETDQTIYVQDLKQYHHNTLVFGKDIRDLNWSYYQQTNQPYDSEQHLTNAHHHQYRLHYDKQNINDVVPLVKHAEYFEPISRELYKSYEQHDQTILENLYQIERNGLKTYEKIVYSEYNPYTSTGRPSNRFGGLNFAALNKKDGSRKKFVSRFDNGVLVEFDYDAYHPRLIGSKINYKFPNGSVHQHLADTYGLSYDEGKALTFKYLYGGITNEIKDNPFFSKVDEYIQELWNGWKKDKKVVSDIYNREIHRVNLPDMNPNKLFNYMIQLMETEKNIEILNKLISEIKDNSSKLILYNYDAFLFDFDYKKDGLEYLKKVKDILEDDGKYPTRVYMGDNYHEMKEITEKFIV